MDQFFKGRPVLIGHFRLSLVEMTFLTFWLVLSVTVTLFTALEFFGDEPLQGFKCLGGVAMFGLACVLVLKDRWYSRRDIAWLSDVIQSALTDNSKDEMSSEIQ